MRRTYDTSPAPLLVVAPTPRELGRVRSSRLSGVGVATVGIGRDAGIALRAILEARPPSIVLSLGFSGGLSTSTRTGALVLSPAIREETDPAAPILLDAASLALAQSTLDTAGVPFIVGDLLTVAEPLLSGDAKLRHGLASGATVVDMEGYWLAREAAQAGVPLVCVRAVIDEAGHDLPTMVADLVAAGGKREWRQVARAMAKPATARSIVSLALKSRQASAALHRAAQALVPELVEQRSPRVVSQ